jgi:hypothetical protein
LKLILSNNQYNTYLQIRCKEYKHNTWLRIKKRDSCLPLPFVARPGIEPGILPTLLGTL